MIGILSTAVTPVQGPFGGEMSARSRGFPCRTAGLPGQTMCHEDQPRHQLIPEV